MVGGIEKFREAFARFSDNFVIIGGAACDEVLSGTSMRPRATLDIDLIVIAENMTPEFAKGFGSLLQMESIREVFGKMKTRHCVMCFIALITASQVSRLRSNCYQDTMIFSHL